MMSLSVYPMPEEVDIQTLATLYENELRKQLDHMFAETTKFVPLARRLIELARADGLDAKWTYASWSGLTVQIYLPRDGGFDRVFDLHEACKEETQRLAVIYAAPSMKPFIDPLPDDVPELKRRSWTFRVGGAVLTLSAFGHYNSEICRMVENGSTPKYELVCDGSPLPAGAAL